MLSIKQMILTNKNRPKLKFKRLKGIVMHGTANENIGADAVANRSYFNNTTTAASAHYIVDDKQIVQCIPDDEVAWHVGAKRYTAVGLKLSQMPYSPNYFLIGIEMCVNKDGVWSKTYQNTLELVEYLLKKYKLTVDDVYRHYDITGKACPRMMVDESDWKKFKGDLLSKSYKIAPIRKGEVIASVLNCREEPSTLAEKNGKLTKGTIVNIYDTKGDWYLVNKTFVQWVCSDFVKIL